MVIQSLGRFHGSWRRKASVTCIFNNGSELSARNRGNGEGMLIVWTASKRGRLCEAQTTSHVFGANQRQDVAVVVKPFWDPLLVGEFSPPHFRNLLECLDWVFLFTGGRSRTWKLAGRNRKPWLNPQLFGIFVGDCSRSLGTDPFRCHARPHAARPGAQSGRLEKLRRGWRIRLAPEVSMFACLLACLKVVFFSVALICCFFVWM